MVNKKAQDLSIGTLILIVLGIIVLVLLILGFSIGWQNLWEKIGIFGGTSSIGDVVTACKLAVTSQDTFGYCNDFKEIKIDGKTEYVNCEDGRVAQSLTDKMDCVLPEGYDSMKKWYCTQLTENKRPAKINDFVCEKTVGPPEPVNPNP